MSLRNSHVFADCETRPRTHWWRRRGGWICPRRSRPWPRPGWRRSARCIPGRDARWKLTRLRPLKKATDERRGEHTLTNGTRFLSSCTDRLVFVTESKEDLNGSKRFTPECGHNGEKKRCGNTHRPAGHGFCPCRFQNRRPGREEKKSLVPQSGEEEERCCLRESSADLDVEFQVLIHGKDVVENVLGDTGDDAHQVRVVQLALQSQSESHLCFKQQQLSTNTFIQNLFSFSLPSCCVLPPWCESSRRRFVHMRKWCHCIHPEHLTEERKREENQVAATKTYCKTSDVPPSQSHLWRSAWPRCCTPAPGWCWWGTPGRRRRTSPAMQHKQPAEQWVKRSNKVLSNSNQFQFSRQRLHSLRCASLFFLRCKLNVYHVDQKLILLLLFFCN